MFKHTASLMGVRDAQQVEVPKDVNARRRFMDQLAGDIQALTSLQDSPGWALFAIDIKNERRDILGRMELAQDPVSLSKLVGCQLVLESFLTWPQDRAQELQQVLKDME